MRVCIIAEASESRIEDTTVITVFHNVSNSISGVINEKRAAMFHGFE